MYLCKLNENSNFTSHKKHEKKSSMSLVSSDNFQLGALNRINCAFNNTPKHVYLRDSRSVSKINNIFIIHS